MNDYTDTIDNWYKCPAGRFKNRIAGIDSRGNNIMTSIVISYDPSSQTITTKSGSRYKLLTHESVIKDIRNG